MAFIKKIWGRCGRIHRNIRDIFRFWREATADNRTAVLVSHSADSSGGASLVLFELAVLLRKRGYRVLFLSRRPGDLLDACKAAGISGFLADGFLPIYLRKLAGQKPACFLINTAVCHKSVRLLQKCKAKAPLFWWLHEENRILEANRKVFAPIVSDPVQVLCVSYRVKEMLTQLCPELGKSAALLPYGCRDLYREPGTEKKETFVILSVGRLCSRKNQLQLVEAVEGLPEDARSRLLVNFIYGSSEPEYEAKLRTAICGKACYQMIGRVSRERIPEMYATADLLVCTSQDDPLPVVVTEAMMLHCPVIVSSETGHYPLIRDGENGWRYDVRDVVQLRSRIMEAIQNTQISSVTAAARRCYEQNFSLSVLEQAFFTLLEGQR